MINCDGTSALRHIDLSEVFVNCINSSVINNDQGDNIFSPNPITFISTKEPLIEAKSIPECSFKRKTISKGTLRRKKKSSGDLLHHCSHHDCMKNFKTKKQLASHHDRLELDCLDEKKLLITLLKQFNNSVRLLDTEQFSARQSKNYQQILEQIDSAKSIIGNNDQFTCLMDKLMKN